MDITGFGKAEALGSFAKIEKLEIGQNGELMYPQIVAQFTSQRNLTVERFGSPGEDAAPLPGDFILAVSVQRSGGASSAGVIDGFNGPEAQPGERRTYARSEDGTILSEIWQRNDGSIEARNDKTSVLIAEDGTINISVNEGSANVVISADGQVSMTAASVTADIEGDVNLTAASVTVDAPTVTFTGIATAEDFITESGISLKDHLTSGVTAGVGTSGPPVP